MSTTDELVRRAKFLRSAAPQQFQDFHAAFIDYTDRKYEELLDAGAHDFMQKQGHAQMCKAVVHILEGAKNG